MDPPFTKLDILSCRNLLIYLAPEVQKKLIPLFHYSLNPGGILFLGSAETVGTFTDLFAPLDGKIAALSADRVRPAARAGRVSLLLCSGRSPAGTDAHAGVQTAGQSPVAGGSVGPAALRSARRCSSMTRATSSTSAAGPANTWSRPPARPTGIFLPWPAKACATNWPAPSRKRSRQDRAGRRSRGLKVERQRRRAVRRCHRPAARRSRSRCGGW